MFDMTQAKVGFLMLIYLNIIHEKNTEEFVSVKEFYT